MLHPAEPATAFWMPPPETDPGRETWFFLEESAGVIAYLVQETHQ